MTLNEYWLLQKWQTRYKWCSPESIACAPVWSLCTLYVQLFWFHVVSCCMWKQRCGLPVLWVAALFPPVKDSIVPHSPVNWLITSLMHMEQPVTMDTLSDSQVTSEPKTRACLIWENGLPDRQDSSAWGCECKGGHWLSNGWISVSVSDRWAVNLILCEEKIAEQLLFVWE